MQNNDLISRSAAINAVSSLMPSLTTPDGTGSNGNVIISAQEMCVDALQALHELPTVSTMPIAPVKIERYDNGQGRCPLCKTDIPFQVVNDKWAFELYCPHCGAKMDLEDGAK